MRMPPTTSSPATTTSEPPTTGEPAPWEAPTRETSARETSPGETSTMEAASHPTPSAPKLGEELGDINTSHPTTTIHTAIFILAHIIALTSRWIGEHAMCLYNKLEFLLVSAL